MNPSARAVHDRGLILEVSVYMYTPYYEYSINENRFKQTMSLVVRLLGIYISTTKCGFSLPD